MCPYFPTYPRPQGDIDVVQVFTFDKDNFIN
jgi:hypothetical protein